MSVSLGAVWEITRGDLCRRLEKALVPGVTVLRAPAGYGKSTVLRQASRTWLAAGAVIRQIDLSSRQLEASLGHLLVPAPAGNHTVAVLDQLHAIEARTWKQLTAAIRSASPHFHLVLATRHALPRDTQQACETLAHDTVGTEQLRFSAAECRTILSARWSAERSMAQGDELCAMTGGWPAAVVAAASGSRDGGGGFHVRGTWAQYVRLEILEVQTAEVRAFLRGTVFLGTISAELCDAVLGRCDSAEIIDSLRSQELIRPVPDEPGWFCHHPLLAETLRDAFHEEEPTVGRLFHSLAARWHAQRGDQRRSLRHQLALGDYAAAATILLGTEARPAPADVDALLAAVTERAASPQHGTALLSARELEVLALLAAGLVNKQIAKQLYISVGTVKSHIYKMFRKLKVKNRTSAIFGARRLGLLR